MDVADIQPGAYIRDERMLYEVLMFAADGRQATIEDCVTGRRRMCGLNWLARNMTLVRCADHDIPVAA